MTDGIQEVISLIMYVLTHDIFVGYGLYSIIYICVLLFKKNSRFLNKLDTAACRVIIWSGVIYFLLFVADNTWSSLIAESDIERYAILNRMFGPYWWAYFYSTLLYAVLPQLLWIEKIRKSKIFRVVTGVSLLMPLEIFVIFITSLHRDYLPTDWTIGTPLELFLGMFLKMLIFVVIAWIYYFVDERIKKNHAPVPLDL